MKKPVPLENPFSKESLPITVTTARFTAARASESATGDGVEGVGAGVAAAEEAGIASGGAGTDVATGRAGAAGLGAGEEIRAATQPPAGKRPSARSCLRREPSSLAGGDRRHDGSTYGRRRARIGLLETFGAAGDVGEQDHESLTHVRRAGRRRRGRAGPEVARQPEVNFGLLARQQIRQVHGLHLSPDLARAKARRRRRKPAGLSLSVETFFTIPYTCARE